jgi:hypothetical protein
MPIIIIEEAVDVFVYFFLKIGAFYKMGHYLRNFRFGLDIQEAENIIGLGGGGNIEKVPLGFKKMLYSPYIKVRGKIPLCADINCR